MDFRFALRILRRSPGFAAIAVLTLALGIGISTAVFTVYDAVALKPIAARAPGELVRIAGTQNGRDLSPFTWAEYRQIKTGTRSLAGVIATSPPQTITGGPGGAELLQARFVSGDYFDLLGVAPHLGRAFLPSDRDTAAARRLDPRGEVVGLSIRSNDW